METGPPVAQPAAIGTSWLLLFMATVSHGLIDACTNGGYGVGFFIPFENTRYVFPVHPIKVSPLSVTRFFTERGLDVLRSEAFWIGIPVLWSFSLRAFFRKIIQSSPTAR